MHIAHHITETFCLALLLIYVLIPLTFLWHDFFLAQPASWKGLFYFYFLFIWACFFCAQMYFLSSLLITFFLQILIFTASQFLSFYFCRWITKIWYTGNWSSLVSSVCEQTRSTWSSLHGGNTRGTYIPGLWIRIGFMRIHLNADPDPGRQIKADLGPGYLSDFAVTNILIPAWIKFFMWVIGHKPYIAFCSIFLILGPDPHAQYGSWSGSRGDKSVRIHAHPDPQHCLHCTYRTVLGPL